MIVDARCGALTIALSLLAGGCGGKVSVQDSASGSCLMPKAVGSAPGVEQTSSGLCNLQAADEAGHVFGALCDETGCDCYYDGALRCSCPARQGWASTCSNGVPMCCLQFPVADIAPPGASD